MAWPEKRKANTRNQILECAAQLFSEKGFDRVSIDDVMRNAGLTRGGFYSHFQSKDALYAEAIKMAAQRSVAARLPEASMTDAEKLHFLLDQYLDVSHLSTDEPSCPLAFMATDVAHRNDEVRDVYTKVYKRLVIFIAKLMGESADSDRVLALTAMMIGGVAVANSLQDEKMVTKLLAACRKFGDELIQDETK
ncbi:TetR/AcrR family transcriptional regulator [Thiomicrorhabdus xiamenensis]|uniref:TetR/AcrR family transcriptional regulator n=1 Tax=Thiomicrorhabdus xiamenensis TaxID=2739063 RepID=A0A7D4NKI4_9GAMM|nr:TetR/AcrR family transcriptional regulator [Thiomicrorhabdus xiamenensis]QKI89249.1 TetR/AcrR family transcriptional regulator [Thiomicrorhabdus xiamenensis]